MRLVTVRFLSVSTLLFSLWVYPQLAQAWNMSTLPMPGCSCMSVDDDGRCNSDDMSAVAYCCYLCTGAPMVPGASAISETPSVQPLFGSPMFGRADWSISPDPFPPKAIIST
jgi:hypothetical protein